MQVSRASRVECRVLAQLLHAKLPAVATQLSKLAPPPAATTHTKAGGMTHGSGGGYGSSSSSSLGPLVEVLAQGWFANGFATTLPLEVRAGRLGCALEQPWCLRFSFLTCMRWVCCKVCF